MLNTARLRLREWGEADAAPLTCLFADAQVMRYFDATRDAAFSARWIAGVRDHFARRGFGIWAVEAPGVAAFIGFVGLSEVPATMPGCPGVEIVWTLAAAHWRRGYASEAAAAAMADGFGRLGLAEIVAFTAAVNAPSRQVMHRLGMRHDPREDFDHPRIAPENALCRHVIYRAAPPGRAGAGASKLVDH